MTDEEIKQLKEAHEILDKLQDEKIKKHIDWIKQVLILAAGLMSILVSLHSKSFENKSEKLFFILTISLLALGILNGVIFLFVEVKRVDLIQKAHIELLERKWAGTVKSVEFSDVILPKIFDICWKIFAMSLILSLVTLVFYTISLS